MIRRTTAPLRQPSRSGPDPVAARVANYEVSEPVPVGEKELVALESLNDWLVGSKLLPRAAAIKDHIVPVSRPSPPR
jgi:hypothetical protein